MVAAAGVDGVKVKARRTRGQGSIYGGNTTTAGWRPACGWDVCMRVDCWVSEIRSAEVGAS